MFTVRASVWIDRSVDDVFNYASDFSAAGDWQADVTRSEQTSDGPLGIGSTGIFAQKIMGREVENVMEVTVYEPPYQLCFRTTSGPISFEGCQLSEEADGGTQFTMEVNAEAAGFFKIAEGMLKNQVQSSFERDLATLKQVLEG